jgi:hypothetical protein
MTTKDPQEIEPIDPELSFDSEVHLPVSIADDNASVDPRLKEVLRQDIKLINDAVSVTYAAIKVARYPGELLSIAQTMTKLVEARRKTLMLPYGRERDSGNDSDKPSGWGTRPI